jgi:Tfp pilus assembly protein PilX
MTSPRRHGTTARGRRGSALILVLMLTFALAALAGSAILLSSTASLSTKSREGEKDLRYAADAAVAVGESQVQMNPTALPNTGYTQLATNAAMLAADSTPVPGITYNLYGGITGSATRQNGRFVTLVAQAMDSSRHRTFVRHIELAQESFAKFAYFSNNENGICFGSGDILYGPVFSNGDIATCSGQKATFFDSVGAHGTVTNGNTAADTFYKGYKTGQPAITLPNTSALNGLFARAAVGNTLFTSPNANTDSTGIVKSRLEFVAYNTTNPNTADSTGPGEGFVKFYSINPAASHWSLLYASAHLRDSAEASYLRAGVNHVADWHNCGDWHYVADSVPGSPNPTYSWQFFPAATHDSAWFYNAATGNGGFTVHGGTFGWWDGNGVVHWFSKDSVGGTPVAGQDSDFVMTYNASHSWLGPNFLSEASQLSAYRTAPNATNAWALWLAVITLDRDQNNAKAPDPVCYPGGDPHLVSVERTRWRDTTTLPGNAWFGKGYGWRGGTDTTYTYGTGGPGLQIPGNGYGVGSWTLWPTASPISYPTNSTGTPSLTWKQHHADWPALFPLDSVYNPAFQGVIAVHGTTAVSGNVDGHVTVYTDGSMGMIDNLRLVTDESDTLCKHGMGIVAGNDITALDNAINVPQHWARLDPSSSTGTNFVTLRNGSFGGSLYVESTVMALGSWGAEGLNADSNYVSSVLCPASLPPDNIYKRGCLYVFGSIIQNLRVTVNSGSGGALGFGYSKRYQYDICAVKNPLPYFPTTGRLVLNKYYEHDPNHFNVAALYQALALP